LVFTQLIDAVWRATVMPQERIRNDLAWIISN
jgi:hypothetical protein